MNLLRPALASAACLLVACAPRSDPAAEVQPVQTLASSATEPVPAPPPASAGEDVARPVRAHRGGAFGVGIRPTGSRAQGISP